MEEEGAEYDCSPCTEWSASLIVPGYWYTTVIGHSTPGLLCVPYRISQTHCQHPKPRVWSPANYVIST